MKKKVIIFFLLVISITSIFFLAEDTLSKYRKKVDAGITANIASWNIKVNNESILNKTTLTSEIVPLFEETEHTSANVIAPGSTGYFDIHLDATEVDVSFRFNIKATVSDNSNVSDLVTTDYIINPDTGTKTSYTEEGVTSNILKSNNGVTVRIFIAWKDDDTQIMDNKKDTEAASNPLNKSKMTATIHFSQITT